MDLLSTYPGVDRDVNRIARSAALFAVLSLLAVGVVAGGVAAHEEDASLVVHNQTHVLDEHDEVHTIHLDSATADTEFYVDVHSDDGGLNETATFEAGTTVEDLELELDPTLKNDTTVTVATHAANGTELEAQEVAVDVVAAPTVEFSDQTRELDEHGEVHTITVDTVAANQQYYVDVHSENGDLNTTATFAAGTARSDLELVLDPTLKNTANVTVAVHAENGTELAAQTATVTVEDGGEGTETGSATESTEAETDGSDETEDDGAGFGVVAALVASIVAIAGRRIVG